MLCLQILRTVTTMVYLTHRLLQSLQVVFLIRTHWAMYGNVNKRLSLKPGDLDAVAGRWNVNFTCVLDRTRQVGCNSSFLYFTYQVQGSPTTSVPLDYVRNINDSAIELRRFPDIEAEPGISKMRCVTCRIRGCDVWQSSDVRIKKPHENPQIKDIVVENWDMLSFTWVTKEDNTMYTIEYKVWYCNNSNDAKPIECKISKGAMRKVLNPFQVASHDYLLIIKVNGSVKTTDSYGILETVTSDEMRVNLTEHLKPKKIDHINVTQDQSIKTLLLKPPKTNRNITYNINISCRKPAFSQSKNITHFVNDSNDETHYDRNSQPLLLTEPLVGLPSYSNCSVSVRAISVSGGKWSEWTQHNFQTLQDVPLAAPGSCKGCFQVKETGIDSLFDVIAYFTPLTHEEARGRVELYRVNVTSKGYLDNVTELIPNPLNVSSFLVNNLSTKRDYEISIEAKTPIGYGKTLNLSSSAILVPQLEHRPQYTSHPSHRFIVVVLNETTVRATFKMKDRSGTDKMLLFWCNGRVENQIPCKTVLKWKELVVASTENAINVTYVINLDKDESIHNFIFGTGIERSGMPSGITWNSCTYDITSDPPIPDIESFPSTVSGISIFLKETSCQSITAERGFVIGYRLFFCPIESTNTTDERGCLEEMRIVEFDGELQVLNLNGLRTNQTYLVLVQSLSETKTSENITTYATTLAIKASHWVANVVATSVVILFAATICLALWKGKPLWRYLKDFRTVGKIVVPPACKFANIDSGHILAEDEGYKSNTSGGTENEAMSVAVPLLSPNHSLLPCHSDVSADENNFNQISLLIDADAPDTHNDSEITDAPVPLDDLVTADVDIAFIDLVATDVSAAVSDLVTADVSVACNDPVSSAFSSPANADVAVDCNGPSVSNVSEVLISSIDVPINVATVTSVIPSVSSSLIPIKCNTSGVDDCCDRILPSLFTASTKVSQDPPISAINRGTAEADPCRNQLQQPIETSSKTLSYAAPSDGGSYDQYYTGNTTDRSTKDEVLCRNPANFEEDYVGGSQRFCDVILPVPCCEPARPVVFDGSGSEEFHRNDSDVEGGVSSLQTELYHSSVAMNDDTSSETGYHCSKVSPSRSADSVCDENRSDGDYPPMRIIEVGFYEDNGIPEMEPAADNVTVSTDVVMISDKLSLSTDLTVSDNITTSTGDVVSGDVIMASDVMTGIDDLVWKKSVDCSPMDVLLVCEDYEPDESDDGVYSTVVDINVPSRAVDPLDPALDPVLP